MTPAGRRRGISSQILCIRYNQDTIKPVLSVQKEFNLGSGIIRGSSASDRLSLDRFIDCKGKELFGADLRTGTISVWEHQIRYLLNKQSSNDKIISIITNGNLTQNSYFVAWFKQDGLLIRLKDEPIATQTYDCVVIDKDNKASIEQVRFQNQDIQSETGWQAIYANTNKLLSPAVQFLFSGQRVVKNGQAISHQELATQIISGCYADLRHVFRFAAVPITSYWLDLGLEQFYSNRKINVDTVMKALRYEPISVRWRNYCDDVYIVKKALADKGYQESNNGVSGTYYLTTNSVNIVFLEAIYCHNILGIDKQGNLCSMYITGWSNNVGTTLAGLSQLAANVFQDAILLNNGGDVFYLTNYDQKEQIIPYSKLSEPRWTIVESCEQRYYIRSVLLMTCDRSLNEQDIQVLKPNFDLNIV
ncbi:hypothetical protein UH38_06740 [Aliterella atlantica CENA595]|uniref:Uncharacterized protein n=2 Tax=Aliterella TaxID=1827277 RepID=A0A0D8ZUK9_9CYAN|nr:hypothetical protein UH38_06740 [Aliterella atlantica CENA595]